MMGGLRCGVSWHGKYFVVWYVYGMVWYIFCGMIQYVMMWYGIVWSRVARLYKISRTKKSRKNLDKFPPLSHLRGPNHPQCPRACRQWRSRTNRNVPSFSSPPTLFSAYLRCLEEKIGERYLRRFYVEPGNADYLRRPIVFADWIMWVPDTNHSSLFREYARRRCCYRISTTAGV